MFHRFFLACGKLLFTEWFSYGSGPLQALFLGKTDGFPAASRCELPKGPD